MDLLFVDGIYRVDTLRRYTCPERNMVCVLWSCPRLADARPVVFDGTTDIMGRQPEFDQQLAGSVIQRCDAVTDGILDISWMIIEGMDKGFLLRARVRRLSDSSSGRRAGVSPVQGRGSTSGSLRVRVRPGKCCAAGSGGSDWRIYADSRWHWSRRTEGYSIESTSGS